MILLKEADFRRSVKDDPSGVYFFFGEEDYMKSAAISIARTSVCGGEKAGDYFNDIRLGGADFTADQLVDAINAPPMMADKKIITVTGVRLDDMKNDRFEDLCAILADEFSNGSGENLVIFSVDSDAFDCGTLPKRPSQRLVKLAECANIVYFERNTPAKLQGWVAKHYKHRGVEADANVCSYTIDRCGRNMYNLASEIEKISAYVLSHGRFAVTAEDVNMASIPAVEYDAFAFANAITEHRRDLALDILSQLKFRREEPLFILSEINKVFCDMLAIKTMLDAGKTTGEISSALHMHEYRVGIYARQARVADVAVLKEAVRLCDDTDKAMKLSSKGYELLERLICSI